MSSRVSRDPAPRRSFLLRRHRCHRLYLELTLPLDDLILPFSCLVPGGLFAFCLALRVGGGRRILGGLDIGHASLILTVPCGTYRTHDSSRLHATDLDLPAGLLELLEIQQEQQQVVQQRVVQLVRQRAAQQWVVQQQVVVRRGGGLVAGGTAGSWSCGRSSLADSSETSLSESSSSSCGIRRRSQRNHWSKLSSRCRAGPTSCIDEARLLWFFGARFVTTG